MSDEKTGSCVSTLAEEVLIKERFGNTPLQHLVRYVRSVSLRTCLWFGTSIIKVRSKRKDLLWSNRPTLFEVTDVRNLPRHVRQKYLTAWPLYVR